MTLIAHDVLPEAIDIVAVAYTCRTGEATVGQESMRVSDMYAESALTRWLDGQR